MEARKRPGLHLDSPRKQLPGAGSKDICQGIVDLVRLTKPDNTAILIHGVSLSLRGSGRLDTRLDTPPISYRHHPVSCLAPQPDPASESDQHLGRFAKAEITAPAPHIRGQFCHCRHDADALSPSRDLPDSLLEPFQRFRRNRALGVRTYRKAEPEELPFLRSCHRTLGLVYLELELLCDEARDALHHPLTRSFAANVNVTVVRVANKAMSPALQLPVEFVENEVTQQWRKRSSLRSSFSTVISSLPPSASRRRRWLRWPRPGSQARPDKSLILDSNEFYI